KPASCRKDEARQQLGYVVLAAVAATDERDVRPGVDGERHTVDAIGAAVLGVRKTGGGDLSRQARNRFRRIDHELRIDDARRLELGDDLLVLDADVLLR